MSETISGAKPVLKPEPVLKPTRMSLRSCGLRSRSIAATVHLDKLFHRTIFSIPRPDRGRASKAFKGRGRPERRAGDAARSLRDRRGDTRDGWRGGRAAGSQAPHGGPSRAVPARHSASRDWRTAAFAPPCAGARGQLLQRWIDAGRPRGTTDGIRNVSHRGSRGASLQTPRAERRGTGISVMKTACALKLIFVHRVTGCSAPRRSARPRTFSSTARRSWTTAYPAPTKQ